MPHGHCYLWKPGLVWTHAVSDTLIGISYFAISITLYILVKRIRLPFSAVALCFGIFIGACGLTHLMEVWTLWQPEYWWSALVKVVTAIASVGTGIYLFKLRHAIFTVGQAAKLSEQRRLDLEVLTTTLEQRVEQRTRALEESRSQIRLITDALPFLISYIDQNHRYRFANASYEKWFHRKPEEVLGNVIANVIGEKAYRLIEKPLSEAFSGRPVQFETETVYSDGQPRGIRATYVPDRKPDGTVAGVVTLVEDITERVKAEKHLHEALEFNRRILESSDDCFKLLDLEGRLIFLSEKSKEHLETHNVNKLIGESWISFWKRPEDREAAKAAIENAAKGGRGQFLGHYRTPSGKREWWSVVVTPMLGANGKPEKLLAVSRDETSVQRSEQALRDAIAVRDEFISIASHELKTPITSMMVQSQILERLIAKGEFPDPQRLHKTSSNFTRQLAKLNRLVEDMLDVSRIDTGTLQLSLSDVDVEQLINEVIEQFQYKQPIRVRIEGKPKVRCDSIRIEQTLTNLLSNAIKYGENNPIDVVAREMDSEIEIKVRDYGMGISKDEQERIFGIYERAIEASAISGFGLGLYIAQRIVKVHGGQIQAESEPKKGATFTLKLPKHPPNPQGASYGAT